MSSDQTPNVPASRDTRAAVREKAQQVHARQARARVMRSVLIGGLALAVVGSAGYGVYLAVSSTVSAPTLSPSNMDDDGMLVHEIAAAPLALSADAADAGDTAAADDEADAVESQESATGEAASDEAAPGSVDIHIYVDYLSPGAGVFENANASQLADWIDQGAATVTYHPVALLTASSNGTKYSLRAASAAACVATHSAEDFYTYNHELLRDQPAVDTDGHSDQELADLAVAVGVEDIKTVRSCIEGKDFASWAKDATARALEGPLPGTDDLALQDAPMVLVNGQAYVGALNDPAEFSQFVLTVASDSYYANPTPAPSATPTPTATPAS